MKSKKAIELSESMKKKGEKKIKVRTWVFLVDPSSVCLFTKMPWKLCFHKSKTPKMCFQFS